jgi:hypothetical protein
MTRMPKRKPARAMPARMTGLRLGTRKAASPPGGSPAPGRTGRGRAGPDRRPGRPGPPGRRPGRGCSCPRTWRAHTPVMGGWQGGRAAEGASRGRGPVPDRGMRPCPAGSATAGYMPRARFQGRWNALSLQGRGLRGDPARKTRRVREKRHKVLNRVY